MDAGGPADMKSCGCLFWVEGLESAPLAVRRAIGFGGAGGRLPVAAETRGARGLRGMIRCGSGRAPVATVAARCTALARGGSIVACPAMVVADLGLSRFSVYFP